MPTPKNLGGCFGATAAAAAEAAAAADEQQQRQQQQAAGSTQCTKAPKGGFVCKCKPAAAHFVGGMSSLLRGWGAEGE